MSVRRLATQQPESFAFSAENAAWADTLVTKYPEGRQASAVIPLLWRVQEQEGWVSEPAIRAVAEMLDMPTIRVLEVATFYTMFHLAPVGKKAHVQVCGTTPCKLRGADKLIAICKSRIAAHAHEVSADGDFSWEEVECLGACANAPMVEVFSDTYEDLDEKSFEALLDAFAKGETPKPGPQNGRTFAMPESGATSLTDPSLYDGSRATAVPDGLAMAQEALRERENAPAEAEEAKPEPTKAEKPAEKKPEPKKAPAKEEAEAKVSALDDDERPPALDAPEGGKADNLKEISGVGPKIEKTLNSIGIFHFHQIAEWNEDNKAWVDGYLKFKGRIDRENWIDQAKTLASGEETEFSKRVSSGKVPSSDGGEG